MAARFLFHKFPSCMSGSKRLLRSCASASASAGAQVTHAASESSIRTLTDLSNGAAFHPWTAVSNNGGIRAHSIRALTNVSHGTGFCPRMAVCSKSGIHASAFVDSVGGEKRAFSSDARKAKMATWAAEWDAKSAAWQAQQATWKVEIEA